MRNRKTKTFLGLAAAAFVALTMATGFNSPAEADTRKSPTMKMQVQKKPVVPPRPTGPQSTGNIKVEQVFIKDHWWAQFYDVDTGEHTGCHDTDNGLSCEGSCPCN